MLIKIFIIVIILNLLFFLSLGRQRILVIGGTGRVGRNVVSNLLEKGLDTVCLVRDVLKANAIPQLVGAQFYQGDVSNIDDLLSASVNCDAIIDVHGVRPLRFSKVRDLFIHPSYDKTHPYNVNYVGVKKTLTAMKLNGVKKIIRLTGGLVGKSPLSPFVLLFNLLLSMTVKWHERAEYAIRESGLNYTVIRAPELVNCPRARDANESLVLLSSDVPPNLPKTAQRKVSVLDVADVCVCAATDDALLNKCTVYLATSRSLEGDNTSGKENQSLGALMTKASAAPDQHRIGLRRHGLAAVACLSILSSLAFNMGWTILKILLAGCKWIGARGQ